MAKIVVHVGPSWTGVRYLQNLLFHNRAALRAAGINYPYDGWAPGQVPSHDALCRLLQSGRHDEARDSLRRIDAGGYRIVVLSCASFAQLAPPALEVLRDALGANPVQLVYYCRRWCERIPFEWRHAVQAGLDSALPDYYAACTRDTRSSRSVNYSLAWDALSQVFGRTSLRLVSYNNLRDRNVDLFRHFAATFLGWTGDAAAPDRFLPDAPVGDAVDTEMLRALNDYDRQQGGPRRQHLGPALRKLRQEPEAQALAGLMAHDIGGFEIRDAAEAFRLSWGEMQAFADLLVGRRSRHDHLFELRTLTAPHVRTDYLIREPAARAVRALYRRLSEEAIDALPPRLEAWPPA